VLKPIRRAVTGNDAQGGSRVLFDGPAPNVNPRAVSPGAGMTDVWVFDRCPALVSGERDDGHLPFSFEPPEHGGHLRVVQSQGRLPGYDPSRDASAVPVHEPRQRPGGTCHEFARRGRSTRTFGGALTTRPCQCPTIPIVPLFRGRRRELG